MLGNIIMAMGLAMFAESLGVIAGANAVLTFGYTFPRAAAASIGLLIIFAPVFAVIGGLLRRFNVASAPIYAATITASTLATGYLLTGGSPDRFELGAVALMTPGALLGGLALGWGLHPRA